MADEKKIPNAGQAFPIEKPALTKAYSLPDLRSVGISNKSEFNTAKITQFSVFIWSEFRPDMHQAFMVNAHYTKYEQA